MIVYKIDAERSKISLSSKIGNRHVEGNMRPEGGRFVSELGEVIEGNVRLDLSSLTIENSTLVPEEQEKLIELLKNSEFLNNEDSIANYSIETVSSQDDSKKIKGLLRIGNQAYGVNMKTDIHQIDNDLHAEGKIRVSRSNFELLDDVGKALKNKVDFSNGPSTLEINCDLYATASENRIGL